MLIGFNIGFDELRGHQFDYGPSISVYWPRNEQMHRPPCRSNRVGCWQKEAICARLSCLLNNRFPCSSTPWIWKTFAKSIPIVLTFMIAAPVQ
jgi:hypothetical protein